MPDDKHPGHRKPSRHKYLRHDLNLGDSPREVDLASASARQERLERLREHFDASTRSAVLRRLIDDAARALGIYDDDELIA